ncbi:MAG: AAA family ATPase [Prevotella sp.]|uniref:ATP-dependent DNA helicase n=1 Tax=Prevotella sp. TaxID=59823 RepID=UPI0025883391|nr:AAA family ATPase [Prevotella sp.]MDD6854060.1 AAA family ATPase [Prevotella sp.]
MIEDEITFRVLGEFHFTPTAEQRDAVSVFASFITDRDPRSVMVLRGSAGTGKTVLAGAIVKAMTGLGRKVMLLAPTGRAAKVFALNSGHEAFTIHRRIYRERTFSGPGGSFNLNDNLYADTLFIVDEASMISNMGHESAFGSGRLLDDLISYVYSGRNCRMLLVGDMAQLPPIGETASPALSADVLRAYGLHVHECDLRTVVRQGSRSGILHNATALRTLIDSGDTTVAVDTSFTDVRVVPGNELIEQISTSYGTAGMDDTIIITRSNKRANVYNQGIRNTILDREEPLSTGDILMVVRNKYLDPKLKAPVAFIANGDRGIVRRVSNFRDLYGFHFADVSLEFPDYDNFELDTTVILDTLTSESPALTREQNEKLFNAVMDDYADIPLKANRMKGLREDTYYNALQVKFGYAVTCHKAQGGQWTDVFVDQGYLTDDMIGPDYIHWLYTAFTRATGHLYLVNWPERQTLHSSEPADE